MALGSLSTGRRAPLPLRARLADEFAGHDDDFLVGEADFLALLEGADGGKKSDASDGADHDDVGVGVADHLLHWGELGVAEHSFGEDGGGGVEEGGVEFGGLLLKEVDVASRGQADDAEAVGEGADDVEGLPSDGAGGTEDNEAVSRQWSLLGGLGFVESFRQLYKQRRRTSRGG